ncbi:hypothetical protein P7C70_g4264, partial [Phenoliferia sp. Uapishka_3]
MEHLEGARAEKPFSERAFLALGKNNKRGSGSWVVGTSWIGAFCYRVNRLLAERVPAFWKQPTFSFYSLLDPDPSSAPKLANLGKSQRGPMWSTIQVFATAALAALVSPAAGQAQTHNLTPDGYWHNVSTALVTWVATVGSQRGARRSNETNNWQDIIAAYSGQKLVFSITGHGLGGMHSLIASVDLNHQNIAYYSHTQDLNDSFIAIGVPRTFNQAGANYYSEIHNLAESKVENFFSSTLWSDYYFNGEAGERAIAGNDLYTESIPASANYSHAGTPFYYSGLNVTASGMNMEICWGDAENNDGPIVDDPACAPRPQVGSTAEEDHYFYFTPVTQCGAPFVINTTTIDNFLETTVMADADAYASASSVASVSSASVLSASSLSTQSVASVSSASILASEARASASLAADSAGSSPSAVATAKSATATDGNKTSSGSPFSRSLPGWLAIVALGVSAITMA